MATPFLDISFPNAVARGATGGPGFSTTIVSMASGAEQRNALWANSRGKWDISTGIRTREQMQAIISHFYIAQGRAWSFRFKDWNDYEATNVVTVKLSDQVYQLVKRYNIGGHEHVRNITKPVNGTVVVKVGGTVVTPVIDYLVGQLSFGTAPSSVPTASFDFDVPVRFDSDDLPVQANAWDQQIVSEINLVEVRE
jgi:uncharacterized protein (TIGR02217 family)